MVEQTITPAVPKIEAEINLGHLLKIPCSVTGPFCLDRWPFDACRWPFLYLHIAVIGLGRCTPPRIVMATPGGDRRIHDINV